MTFYLGIDGGGTKTRALLGDESTVLASVAAAGSNVIRLGAGRAREALHKVVADACAAAKIAPERIVSVCIGAAGAARPDVAATIRTIIGEVMSAPVEVVGDMVIALEAAFGAGAGVIAIAGTGSIVYGRDAAGDTFRAGGWGFQVSDEGSGHWIGRRAVSEILRVRDEGNELGLLQKVLEAWNLKSFDDLIAAANSTPAADFSRLFPPVLQAAGERDTLAQALLHEAGAEMARLAAIVLRRLPHPPYAPVAMAGSVFRQSVEVRQVFYNEVKQNFPGVEIREEVVDPVEGALALARKAGAARI